MIGNIVDGIIENYCTNVVFPEPAVLDKGIEKLLTKTFSTSKFNF